MKPKEKAQEIINRFRHYSNGYKWTTTVAGKSVVLVDIEMQFENAKQCALIAVDEIINALEEHQWQNRLMIDYYEEVRKEIEKL